MKAYCVQALSALSSGLKFTYYTDELFHSLRQHNLELHEVPRDGHCLFSSISHQVYGDSKHHELIRRRCMDYMEAHRGAFEGFIPNEEFDLYIARKRRCDWGDEPEISIFIFITGTGKTYACVVLYPLLTYTPYNLNY